MAFPSTYAGQTRKNASTPQNFAGRAQRKVERMERSKVPRSTNKIIFICTSYRIGFHTSFFLMPNQQSNYFFMDFLETLKKHSSKDVELQIKYEAYLFSNIFITFIRS